MAQNIYILYDEQTEYVTNKVCENIFVDKKIYSPNSELTTEILKKISNECFTEYFYVIVTDKELCFSNFDFTYKPNEWDKKYVNIWNNDITVRLFNTDIVSENPSKFNDTELKAGNISIKSTMCKIYTYPIFDIIFLSFDEEYADENYNRLRSRFPRIKRIHNIRGILEAHKAAARLSDTDMFYVVDADAEIIPSFNFDYQPHSLDRKSVHVWHSRNPVNDLEYGYGGIKLFPTNLLRTYDGSPIDFTTTVSNSLKVLSEVASITKFNTDPFSAWRSAFRECVKLASKIIHNQDNTETEYRLSVWCTKGEDREFGDFTIMGANEGADFGRKNMNRPDLLGLINDFEWLAKRFSS